MSAVKNDRETWRVGEYLIFRPTPVFVVAATAEHFRIRAMHRMQLTARRWLDAGEEALVAKSEVRLNG